MGIDPDGLPRHKMPHTRYYFCSNSIVLPVAVAEKIQPSKAEPSPAAVWVVRSMAISVQATAVSVGQYCDT